ncbi:Stealth protein CR3, conserved region 3 [Pedococcus dokdonensis]|uniref:Stealth protein CR3, conserved region 3 n=1 Tax=Pedococcus dokdonensis TaxID=443156 RepID=A0A1H0TIN7_9MICO|nr:Stealth protein CR3, conserved region 3 [Pedococcus dokdonensis]
MCHGRPRVRRPPGTAEAGRARVAGGGAAAPPDQRAARVLHPGRPAHPGSREVHPAGRPGHAVLGTPAHPLGGGVERDPEGHLSSPNNNPLASRIWRSTAEAMDQRSGAWALEDLLPAPAAEVVPFDVDWVFSWVDASDPNWQEMFAAWAPEEASDASDRSRFATRDDLKFALRSLELYAPWIRTIHVLTNCRPPEWLDVDHPRINWVDHTDVFEAEHLPTFSSHAIETVVHRIPGLADHFVYSNDDFFLTRRTEPADFFHANGIARLRLEPYGIVNGPATPGDPDYLNGARNSAALLADEFGRTPVRLHTHSPQSMNRTVLAEMEGKYADAFTRTRANRFRDSTDIAVTGFLYHHYAFLTGRAVPDGGTTLLIQQNHRYARLFAQLLAAQDTGQLSKYLSVCVNDGRGSHDNADWDAQARSFLQSYFAEKSSFER